MSNQILISSGAKLRDLDDVIVGTDGVLTSLGFNVANGVPKLDENGKILVSQLPNSVMEFKGVWNAATNTPTLANGTGNAGDVWLCNVAGTVNFGAGPIVFEVGDYAVYTGTVWARSSGATGTVTSVGVSRDGNALAITGSPITTSGTINLGFSGDNTQYINGAGNLTTFPTLITSIGLTMPAAFNVSNSPLTSNGTIGVTAAGFPSQYIRGDGTLADFPTSGGGGSSVSYYLNGGTSQGTIGGTTYYEMSKTANTGTGADFSKSGDGLITAFLTDAGDPALLQIPSGNWNYEIYASMSANGGTPELYAELYVYDGTTFTLISTSTNEILYDGINLNLYTFAMSVPETTLTVTDRLAIKLYATNSGGKTTTVHTQNGHLCQVITTFTTGLTALNGLTAQVQYFGTGTSGSDFNIVSSVDTHTFNLPTASATKRGALSSADWSTFNNKQNALTLTTTGSSGAATLISNTLNIPTYTLAGLGGVPTTRTLTINGLTQDLSADRTWTITAGISSVSGTAPISVSTVGGAATVSIATANTTTTGALTSTDWNTFNGKQAGSTNLTSLAALTFASTSFVKMTAAGTFALDTNTYATTTALGDYVTLATTQTISGAKTFGAAVTTNGQFFMANTTTLANFVGLEHQYSGSVYAFSKANANLGEYRHQIGPEAGWGGYMTFFIDNAEKVRIGSSLSTFLTNIQLGVTTGTGTSTATPLTINLGDTYSSTAGTNLKLRLFQESTGVVYGIGVSGSQMDFNLPADAQYKFWTGNAIFTNNVTALALIKSGGTSSQFLKADGSVDSSTYLTTATAASTYLALSGGTLTNTSSNKLTIAGGSSQNGISFNAAGLANAFYIFNGTYVATAGFGIFNTTSSTMPFFIFNNGNIGINTTTDAGFKLDLVGTSRFSGGATFSSNLVTGNTITTNKAKAGSGVETNAFLDLIQTGSHAIGDSLLIRFGASGVAYTAQIAGILGADNVAYGSLAFSTRNYFTDSMVEMMRITNRSNILINTTSGVSGGGTLQVNGNVNINGVFQINGTTIGGGGGSGVTGSGTANTLTKWTGSTTLGNTFLTETTGGRLIQSGGDGFLIAKNGSDTIGGGAFTALSNAAQTQWVLQQLNNSNGLDWWTLKDGTTWAQKMTLTQNGNLGLGTTTPTTYSLSGTHAEIFGGSTYAFLHINTTTVKSFIAINETALTASLFTFSNHTLALGTNNTERLRITPTNGNVLIGTTTDAGGSYKLQVNGSITMAYASFFNFRGATSGGDILVDNSGSTLRVGGSVTASGGFFDTSDARLKTLVEDNYLLSSISNVKARLYIKDGRMELGYYAQDLESILPSAVKEGADGFLSLSYAQVHTAKIAVIEDEVTILKNRVSELEKQLNLN